MQWLLGYLGVGDYSPVSLNIASLKWKQNLP